LNRLSVKLIGVSARQYRLGRRQSEVEQTRSRILAAARSLVSELGPESSVGNVAKRAGVSRITIYNQFGSKAALLEALLAEAGPPAAGAGPEDATGDPVAELRLRIERACAAWAADPRLHRQLAGRALGAPGVASRDRPDDDHALAIRLAAHDRLRPGCSIKEAEDVIGTLTSFPVFDRLHKEGRRSVAAVAEIMLRMASAIRASGDEEVTC
jgi:AcrR family transcriptional regulator